MLNIQCSISCSTNEEYRLNYTMQTTQLKWRWLRRLLRTLMGLILFFIVACFLFDHFVQFRKSDAELNKFFKENNIPGRIGYYTALGRSLRYVSIGSDTLP